MRMTYRLLGRSNDQALAAQSAIMVVPTWRIGFLVMPTVISISPIWCRGGGSPTINPAGGSVHVSDFFDEIKTECVKAR